jgi:GNAT superfamily N-acetyltransferase
MLTFSPFSSQEPGVVLRLLKGSYAPLLAVLPPQRVTELLVEWEEYDRAVWDEPETVGSSGFFSSLNQEVLGFSSWDPRSYPAFVEIGHNCILPESRGQGFGTAQIQETLSRFVVSGFQRVGVRTDEHPFFRPALRMYEKCGFRVVSWGPGHLDPEHRTLELHRSLISPAN